MYSLVEYWDDRYSHSDNTYDWYLNWPDIIHQTHLTINEGSNVLHIGCGISDLGRYLKESYNISSLNIDSSHVAIDKMNATNLFPDVKYERLDVINMHFDKEFDFVFDKALFDVILCHYNAQEYIKKLLLNVYGALRPGGVYAVVSFGLIGLRKPYLEALDWKVSPIRLASVPFTEKDIQSNFNVFLCEKPSL